MFKFGLGFFFNSFFLSRKKHIKKLFFTSLIISLGLEGFEFCDEALCRQSWSHFGPLCEYYAAGRKEKPDEIFSVLKTYVSTEATILDLGSGTGISTRQLYKNGFKNVIGVDRDCLMIKEAQKVNCPDCTIKYIRADVSHGLPFPDEEFDVVTAASAFHWFANPSSIKEVNRILKLNGYYFIIGARSRHSEKSQHKIKTQIKKILTDAGVPNKPDKQPFLTSDALEAQGFKIIVDSVVPYEYLYTKQEYLNKIQSKSSWNFVKESQRPIILKQIEQYLDTVLDDQGRIKIEDKETIVLAQKVKNVS